MANLDVSAIRKNIPGIDTAVYLNTGGLGLMPQITRKEIQKGYDALGTIFDPTAWYLDCVARAADLRQQMARFVGAAADEIALKNSVADGYGTVLWGLPWQEGDEILVTSEEHPTARLAVELTARQFGLKVRVIPLCPSSDEFLARFNQTLTPQTRLVAMSHVTTDSGTCIPAEDICRIASTAGILTLLDGAHAVGQVPLNLHALGCDFYASMGYKWALGPMGSGFLFVRRDRQNLLHPIIGGGGLSWQEIAAGHSTDLGTATRFEFASRAWPEYFALGRSLEFLDSIGVPQIHRYTHELGQHLREQLNDIRGIQIHTPASPEPSTGIVSFSLVGAAPRDLSRVLRERWNIAQRAAMMIGKEGGVRISLALYTSVAEVDQLIDAVRVLAHESQ